MKEGWPPCSAGMPPNQSKIFMPPAWRNSRPATKRKRNSVTSLARSRFMADSLHRSLRAPAGPAHEAADQPGGLVPPDRLDGLARGALPHSVTSRPVRLFERRNVELHHLEHGVGHLLGARSVLVAHHLLEDRRNDLPPHPEPIDEPAARLRLAAPFEEGVPVAVQLGLIVAEHHHRDGVVELVVRPRAHGLEALAEEG